MSEALFLVNSRRKKRRKSRKGRMPAGLKRYWASKRRGGTKRRRRRASAKVSRRRRRNPIAAVRTHRRKRRHHARARRRNPRHSGGMGRFSLRGVTRGVVMPAAIGAGGAIVLDVAYAYATPYLPAMLQTGWAQTLTKLAGALGIGYGAGKVLGRERGRIVTLGAVTVVAYGAIKTLVAGFAPNVKGLSGYADYVNYSVPNGGGMGAYLPRGGMGFISPASVVPGSGMGAYMGRPAAGMGDLNGNTDDGM